jgi:diguanylate cyclase (GGDEF)-like protein/PAS domain S-box-containing protein
VKSGTVEANGISIAYEAFGEATAPALLLIMGLGTQMIGWPDELCTGLADAGFHVLRFDNRDVGLSTHLDGVMAPGMPGVFARRVAPPYTINDMADDAFGLLDALDVASAHVVGASMGGFIAQAMAIAKPERVRSLSLIMTSTGSRRVGLPKPGVVRRLLKGRAPGADREAAVANTLEVMRLIGSPGYPFEADYLRDLATRSYERSYDPVGYLRQWSAVAAQPDRTADLKRVRVPTVVMHGLVDPLVAVSGGLAVARAVPGSLFLGFEGMGHDLPRPLWPRIRRAIASVAGEADGVEGADQGPVAEALRASERRYRLLADHARDVIWTMSPAGEITYVSPSVEEVRGLTPEQAMRQPLHEIQTPEAQEVTLAYFARLMERLAAGEPPEEFHGELEYYRVDGSTVWTEVRVIPHLDAQGQLVEVVGVSRDVDQRKREELARIRLEHELREAHDQALQAQRDLEVVNAELQAMALTDQLTGLANRRGLLAALPPSDEPCAAMLIDLDGFKSVNDDLGHAVGDEVLQATGQALRSALADACRDQCSWLLSRWGGDEFLVLLNGADNASAAAIAADVHQAVRHAFADHVPHSSQSLSLSVGVAARRRDEDFDTWLRRTDGALYHAKSAGRDQVAVATAE